MSDKGADKDKSRRNELFSLRLGLLMKVYLSFLSEFNPSELLNMNLNQPEDQVFENPKFKDFLNNHGRFIEESYDTKDPNFEKFFNRIKPTLITNELNILNSRVKQKESRFDAWSLLQMHDYKKFKQEEKKYKSEKKDKQIQQKIMLDEQINQKKALKRILTDSIEGLKHSYLEKYTNYSGKLQDQLQKLTLENQRPVSSGNGITNEKQIRDRKLLEEYHRKRLAEKFLENANWNQQKFIDLGKESYHEYLSKISLGTTPSHEITSKILNRQRELSTNPEFDYVNDPIRLDRRTLYMIRNRSNIFDVN